MLGDFSFSRHFAKSLQKSLSHPRLNGTEPTSALLNKSKLNSLTILNKPLVTLNMNRHMLVESRLFLNDSTETSPQDILSGISKDTLLKIARTFLSHGNVSVISFIEKFICQENIEIARKGLEKLSVEKIPQLRISDYYILTTTVSLNFYELVNNCACPEKDEVHPATIEFKVLKAYLKLNDLEAAKDEVILRTIPEGLPLRPTWLLLISMLRYHSIINVSILKELYSQIVKANLFLEFLNSCQPILLQRLLESLNCPCKEEYIIRFVNLILPTLASIKENRPLEIEIPKDSKFEEVNQFIKSMSHQSIIDDIDYKSLRSAPIFQKDDNTYIPTLPILLIEQIYKGLYFRLSNINSKLKIVRNLKSYLGEFFTEKILFDNLLRTIFRGKYYKKSDSEMKPLSDGNGNPDFYMRNGNKVFIFEIKDALLNSTVICSQDYEVVKSAIYEKFHTNSKGHPKGVSQLAINCEQILTGNIKWDTKYKPNRVKIYPIIVVTDNVFTVPGLNQILNHWFDEYISVNYPDIDKTRIMPLTVLSIDSLICFQDYISNNLEQYLSGYSPHAVPRMYIGNKPMNEELLLERYQDSTMPFDLWLRKQINVDWRNKILQYLSDSDIILT